MSAGAGGGDGGFEGVKKEKRLAMDEVAMAQIWGSEFLDRGLCFFRNYWCYYYLVLLRNILFYMLKIIYFYWALYVQMGLFSQTS